MGTLTYNGSVKAEFEDRTLAHLRVVIGIKLRRNESFYLSWRDDQNIGDGSTTIWINPAAMLTFKFHGSREVQLNPRWIDALTQLAHSNSGLRLVPEPTENSGS
jgi:hypothetical protein